MNCIRTVYTLCAVALLTGCSNLFESLYNLDGTEKTGNSALTVSKSEENDTSSGLVVIKATEPTVNQITYSADQSTYYVGKVPAGYTDDTFSTIGYKNGSSVQLIAKDDPAEFRCYAEDANATVSWQAEQTWQYIPTVKTCTSHDNDGNEISYTGIVSERAEKLTEPKAVRVYGLTSSDKSRVMADIPYGVTVLTCTITADDAQYSSTYRIIVTKSFITAVADSASSGENSIQPNTVTDHGLVVIKATQPTLNAINYDPLTFSYEIGDSTGADTTGDLTGRDDPVIFKCYLLDENASLSWSARQTMRYVPILDDANGGVIDQTLEALDTAITVDLEDVETGIDNIVKANLPYGVTEVYATITAENRNDEGETVIDTLQYTITLTKRYVITAATTGSAADGTPGLAVYANGKDGSLISFDAAKTSYSVTGLNGGNDPLTIRFMPEEPDNTIISWTATQTQAYTATLVTQTIEDLSYTYQTGGTYTDLDAPVDLLSSGTLSTGNAESDAGISLCTGNLPYGTTVVTVTASSTADSESATTYSVTFKKKQVVTNVNIVSSDSESNKLSLITDSGLVVLKASDPTINQISFVPSQYDYSVSGITGADNDMTFRCFLADTDATVTWSLVQTKMFEAVRETTTTTSYDDLLGTTTTVTTTTVTGQTEKDCAEEIIYEVDDDYSDNQSITATIPYGETRVTATVSADGEENSVYTITLTRDIYKASSSSTSTQSLYSLLSELSIDIHGDSTTSAVLTPDFSPAVTTYTLTADDDADSITINATPATADADVSAPSAITKYGSVPGITGNTVPLVGGTSRISFTVTDESGISRTYTIYVIKTNDGDTSLASLTYTPAASFENGVEGFETDTSYSGEDSAGKAKYAMTLSADSRVDVTSVDFTAVPNNKRTTVAYGVSDSINTLPADDDWSDSYSYATQTGTSPVSYPVATGDEDIATMTRVLWVKTVSDRYYHTSSTSTSGYESTKRADTTYHAVKITKAGDKNQKLTALAVVATYENGDSATILTQTSSSTVAYQTTAVSKNITTYADQLDFYFRPLDKDAAVTYKALNTAHAGSDENTSFTGYAASATDSGIETLSSCDYFGDGASCYYHFTLGEIVKGTGVNAQTKDLPNGTTSVTICGITYTFVKPNLSDTSYSVSGWDGNGTGIDYSSRKQYIYVPYETESVVLSLAVAQQNASVRVAGITQTASANGEALLESQDASYAVLHKDTSSDGLVSNNWKISVGNATYSATGYTTTQTGNTATDDEGTITSTIIPVGTSTLVLYVENNGTQKDYTYYIVRADDSEARLKSLKLTSPSKATLQEASGFNWESSAESDTYIADSASTAYTPDKGTITLSAAAVSANAAMRVTKRHSAMSALTDAQDESWESGETEITNSAAAAGSFSGAYTIADEDAGSLLFTITVTSKDGSATHVYYLIAYVEADTTAELTALKVVQNGSDGSDYTNTLLANNFKSDTHSYSAGASLSYTGDIIVTPTVYEKATLSDASFVLLADENDDTTADETLLTFDGTTDTGSGAAFTARGVLTIPASCYQSLLGRTVQVSYSVQAQDSTVDPVTYTVSIVLPTLTTITETETWQYSSEYAYVIPATDRDTLVAYRFGSMIADETTFLGKNADDETKLYFGGIDIIGTSDKSTWYESSFAQSGFQLVVNIAENEDDAGTDYWLHLDDNGNADRFYTVDFSAKTVTEAENPGITLTVTPSFQYEAETPYLTLAFALSNTSGKRVSLGAAIDTLVGTIDEATNSANDSVQVEETDNGFTMNGGDYTFTVCLKNAYGVDDVSRLWYGAYDAATFSHLNVFENDTGLLPENTDSAASFSWDLGSEESYTRTIRINMSKANAN